MHKPIIGGMVGVLLYFPPVDAQPQTQQLNPQLLSQALAAPGSGNTISPLEIQQFAQALKELRKVQMEAQKKMVKAIEDERLSPERFQEIGQRRSDPNFPVSEEITQTEQERFDKAFAKIQTIQQDAIVKQRRAITLEGLTLERFNQISQAVEKDPALKQQLQRSL